jgi:membrane-associated phospholipid phosphatase
VRSGVHVVFALAAFVPLAARADDGATQAPLASPAPVAPPRSPISWRHLVPQILRDQREIARFPLGVGKGRHLVPTLAFTIGTGTALAFDPKDTPYFRRTQSFGGFNKALSGTSASLVTAGAPAALYLAGLIRKDDALKETSLYAFEAAADAEILQLVLKSMTRRLRPSDIAPYGDFSNTFYKSKAPAISGNTAFPSGHTMAAFAVASAIARRHPKQRWVAWVAYGVATAIGFSRVTLQSHFPSDVFAGAFLGIAIGRHVTR